ncbi:hypothetical protein ANN_26454 [Periplaneta americana]|uniref:Tc1-like transposase DDE domain-containing protein n=1 Tax=Periplaneta americana TaxID=6978 RepID=A0ABQ8RY51_PERAM|nr:hypothetical protein ANN_26454 [Periplaneta americana]
MGKSKGLCVELKETIVRLALKEQVFWDSVIWSDETKINLFGSDGAHRVWRKKNEGDEVDNTLSTVKHGGGSIMIWGCMSSKGVGNIDFTDEIMDKVVYNNILKNNVKESAIEMGLPPVCIFQQDDSKHTAEMNKHWLILNVPKQLHTPCQSPDLNPIEHLWSTLKENVHKNTISSKEHLKTVVRKFTPQQCKTLVISMQTRCQAVIKARGYATRPQEPRLSELPSSVKESQSHKTLHHEPGSRLALKLFFTVTKNIATSRWQLPPHNRRVFRWLRSKCNGTTGDVAPQQCQKKCAVSSTQKFLVQQHITTSKHQANKQLNSKQRQLFLTQPTTSNVRSEFNIDFSLISADIPHKLKNKVFREFLEKYTQHTIPDESTLRKTYAPSIYDETIQKIRDEIKDSSIWVSI